MEDENPPPLPLHGNTEANPNEEGAQDMVTSSMENTFEDLVATTMETSLDDIINLPPLPQRETFEPYHSDPLIFTFSEPILASEPSFQPAPNAASFEPNQNEPNLDDPNTIPDPHSLQAINNHLAHMEHFGLLIRQVDLSEPLSNATIISRLSETWKGLQGEISIEELGNAWILFTFATRDARDLVWFNRPYHVQGKLLVVLEYSRLFDPLSFALRSVDMWIRIPFLPFYLHTEQALSMIIERNHAGVFLKVDESSNVKNRRKFARLCIFTSFPNPPKFVHFRHHDNSVLSFEIWYEGFSPGCGCCGDPHHQFEDCFLHNLAPITQDFNPIANNYAAENARRTKLRMLNHIMATHTVVPRAIKPPTFKKKVTTSISQKQIEAFQGNAAVKAAKGKQNTTSPAMKALPSNEQDAETLNANATGNNGQMVPYSPEVAANMHHIAMLVSNPLFKTITSLQAQIVPSNIAAPKEVESVETEKEDQVSEGQEGDESPPKSMKGKEKVVEQPPSAAKRRKGSKNGSLKIYG